MSNAGLISDTVIKVAILLLSLWGLLYFSARVRRGKRPTVRPLPPFESIPPELGRAAEAGEALHLGLGSGAIGGSSTLTSLAGLQLLEGISDAAAAYGTPPIVTVGDPTLLPLAQDALRRACINRGVPHRFDPSSVRFVSPTPSVYALGASDIVAHDRVMGNVLAGAFDEEVTLLAHRGEGSNLLQMAAADRLRALGALYPSDALLASGEELYAGGSILIDSPHLLASLMTQDMLRVLIAVVIAIKILWIF